jgi:hypothetical protein
MLGLAMDACSQRGDWALLQTSRAICFKQKWSIVEYQYAESLSNLLVLLIFLVSACLDLGLNTIKLGYCS